MSTHYCPVCLEEMKPLFTGLYCPNDCDRKTAERARGDALFKTMKERIGKKAMVYVKASEIDWSRIHVPYVPPVFTSVLIEPKPMEYPKGAVFYMDIYRDLDVDLKRSYYSLDQPKRDVCPHPDHSAHRGRKGRK